MTGEEKIFIGPKMGLRNFAGTPRRGAETMACHRLPQFGGIFCYLSLSQQVMNESDYFVFGGFRFPLVNSGGDADNSRYDKGI